MGYNNSFSTYSFSTYVNNVTAISTGSTDVYPLSEPRWSFWSIFELSILIIGTGANIIMMTLLVKEKMKKTSNTVLVGVIVVNDMLFLISYFLYDMCYRIFNYDISSSSTFACKFIYFIKNSMYLISGWLVLALTTERLINVYFPRMIKLFKRGLTGIIITMCIVCAALFLQLHIIIHIDLYPIQWFSDGTIIYVHLCSFYWGNQYEEYIPLYMKYVFPLIAGILPGFCILVENIFLIKVLYQSLGATSSSRRHIRDENRRMLVFATMISMLFLVIDMPYIIITNSYWESGTSFGNVFAILWLLSRSIKCLAYILYKRPVRMRCIVCKAMRQTDDIL